MLTNDRVAQLRSQFPALQRKLDHQPLVYFDGPAGTQVPQTVIDAISDYLSHRNANHGGLFLTSRESDEMLHQAHEALAVFVGADDPNSVYFGPNMTTLTFALSRSLARTWNEGDEIIVTRLDHDANVTPWVRAAEDHGVQVHYVDLQPDDGTLDLDQLQSLLSVKTRLVAIGRASNSTGTVNDVKQVATWAHEVGALVFVDAVHYAPHGRLNVAEWNCDFLACSTYKFFGPHLGVLWGRPELLNSLRAYKVRPASDELPEKWMTGTQNHECIAGAIAAVDYIAGIGSGSSLSERLDDAMKQITNYEADLGRQLRDALLSIQGLKIWGITDDAKWDQRVPTFSVTHPKATATQISAFLGERGICVWHGNYYALQFTETMGLEPEGMVRIGLVHYNTGDEVERLREALAELLN